ncbi:MAG TPA: S41 family peptidase [Gemmataceae bacterium]
MATATPRRLWDRTNIGTRISFLLAALLLLPVSLHAQSAGLAELSKQAEKLEKQHDWLEACRVYDEILHRDRTRDDARRAYQRCLRRYHVVHRHQDKIYREAVKRVASAQALEMYEQVLDTVAKAYVDRQKTSPAALFRQGIDELRFALDETSFRRQYFPDAAEETLDAFKHKLEDWRDRKITSRADARDQVKAVGLTAQRMGLGSRPILLTVITLEFLSGACNALDEYTFFLTPGHYREVQAVLRGRLVSIGVDLAVVEKRLEVLRVYPRSPAWEANLQPHDHILSINGQSTDDMSAEVATVLLRGKAGSVVELEVVSLSRPEPFVSLKLTRRPVTVPSVEYGLLPDPLYVEDGDGMMLALPVGKLTINYFQETTLQEVKEALAALQSDGMKALILDLRGNPGGLFRSAVQTAELFLPEGLIVVSQSHILSREKRLSGPIRAESMNPLLLPMVVLIDGDTASAAEVLAGALKDNGRAKLIGQTTFGKGSLQCVIPLDKPPFDRMPGGIRITVARLLSPNWQPFSGKGIQPNFPSAADGDGILLEARQVLLEIVKALRPMTE